MPEIKQFENFNLKDIITPVNVRAYERLLRNTGYNADKTRFLVEGFRDGFSLEYKGPRRIARKAKNLLLRVGNKVELWNKEMTEVQAERYAGPFEEVPYRYFIQSPIGLVPKDKGKKTRLIFHLSYPKTGDSVNSAIPEDKCSVKYPDFLDAVKLCLKAGKGCACAKSDMSMAFRNVPMNKKSWRYLILKCEQLSLERSTILWTSAYHLELPLAVQFFRNFQTLWHTL